MVSDFCFWETKGSAFCLDRELIGQVGEVEFIHIKAKAKTSERETYPRRGSFFAESLYSLAAVPPLIFLHADVSELFDSCLR